MPLIKCDIDFILAWSANCVIVYTNASNHGVTFAITETRLLVPIVMFLRYVPLSTYDNVKLLQQLKAGFKKTINSNKYLSKAELLAFWGFWKWCTKNKQ